MVYLECIFQGIVYLECIFWGIAYLECSFGELYIWSSFFENCKLGVHFWGIVYTSIWRMPYSTPLIKIAASFNIVATRQLLFTTLITVSFTTGSKVISKHNPLTHGSVLLIIGHHRIGNVFILKKITEFQKTKIKTGTKKDWSIWLKNKRTHKSRASSNLLRSPCELRFMKYENHARKPFSIDLFTSSEKWMILNNISIQNSSCTIQDESWQPTYSVWT